MCGDETYAHVGRCADEGVGDRVDELAGDAKVADLDLSLGIEQDI